MKQKIFLAVSAVFIIIAVITAIILVNQGVFSVGNDEKYSVNNTEALPDSPIKGKTVIFLGSSVTFGATSEQESFIDFLVKQDGITAVKEAVSGTTLVDESGTSYIARMKRLSPDIKADLFICQLSTNDATKRKPLGEISEGFDEKSFDTSTVAGAIEFIICYAKNTWDCPVVFYTGTQYKSERYSEMVSLLNEIAEKWDIDVIDLWNDAEMNAVSKEDYKLYMVNGIHPSRAGYKLWWTPKFREYLYEKLK